MIETELCFFQMQIKRVFWYAFKLRQTVFCVSPKALYSVDVRAIVGKLILAMIDAKMLRIANVHQTIIGEPTVRMNDALDIHFATNRL